MTRTMLLSVCLLAAFACGAHAASEKITVESMPPSVIKTLPAAGDTAVDPALDRIEVTFSKKMMTKDMWSIPAARTPCG